MSNPLAAIQRVWLRRYWSPDANARNEASRGRPAVVVTGGSEGIGLAIADRFAAAGHSIVLVARNEEKLEQAAREIRARHGVEVQSIVLDLGERDAARRLVEAMTARALYADVLVNNAAVGLAGEFTSHTEAEIARLIDLDVRAISLLTRAVLPAMCLRGSGGIINIASLAGYAPGPYQAAYYAGKAYVIALTRAIAYEVRGQGVRVCVVTPGPVETRFHARMGAETSIYRTWVPAASPAAIARSTYRGYLLGCRVIQPGLLTPVLALAMRLLPGIVLSPLIGTLLRPRGTEDARH
ncbi:MAG: SDR family NAD(P)-dependent oxidoreductase [Hyphomicrobiaceae bacterium]